MATASTTNLAPRTSHSLWQIVSTPPLSGEANMAYDRDSLRAVALGERPATLRFFRFKNPTASIGRLQRPEAFASRIPAGWETVQRPTGGGLVLHQNDLCFSLAWRNGLAPVPPRVKDQYRWIHDIALSTLKPLAPQAAMATCHDCVPSAQPFQSRECFTAPVMFDVVTDGVKIVGGALRHERAASLYQGSVQGFSPDAVEPLLRAAFEQIL